MRKCRKLTAVLLAALLAVSGTNVFAASPSVSGTAGSSGKQDADIISVKSVLPDNQTVGVPVNTGIEITFSTKDYSDIDGLFSITPDVKGSFERHGKTVAFVPSEELEYATVYTVTLKAGVKDTVNGGATAEDTVFSFETRSADDADDADDSRYPSWSVYFDCEGCSELPSSELPRISMSYYYDADQPQPDPQVGVYRFGSSDAAVEYLRSNGSSLWWTAFNSTKHDADVGKMTEVGSFKLNERYDNESHVMELPFSLTEGFYVVNVSYEGVTEQMILQITDLPVQVISDGSMTLFWINDAATGKAAQGAAVSVYGGEELGTADKNGVLEISGAIDTDKFYKVTSGGRTAVLMPSYIRGDYYSSDSMYYGNAAADDYWSELQLDRSIYHDDDTVNYWGYAALRAASAGAEFSEVTVTVCGGWDAQDIYYKETVSLNDGSFSGSVKLPSLAGADYGYISVYKGNSTDAEDRLSSEYFTIEDYVKPTYKIELTSDKKALFPGDTVNLTAKASLYEGTPVSGLEVGYNADDVFEPDSGTLTADDNGLATVALKADPSDNEQGLQRIYAGFYAELPEKGEITASEDMLLFVNDINVDIDADRDGKKASLSFTVNDITLDKINASDGTYESGDEIGAPTVGKKLNVTVKRVYWEREKTGTSYNYITKKTEPVYTYNRCEEAIDTFSVTTGSDGKAKKSFNVPNREKESYYAVVSCTDGNGREMTFEKYIGSSYDDYFYSLYNDSLYLYGEKESYGEGDAVSLKLKYGEDNITMGGCMFVELQNGIKSYETGKYTYSGKFTAADAPNKYIQAYYFDGIKYHSGYALRSTLMFDYGSRSLDIQLKTDKESYEPGDECTVTVSVTANGRAKQAHVNLAAVDEAVFDVEEYTVDTLQNLYNCVGDGIVTEFATHSAYRSESGSDYGRSGSGGTADSVAGVESSLQSSAMADESYSGETVRDDFEDTAAFASLDTDASGKASYTFTLPDDITSWRLTASAISDDLYAGNEVGQIITTAPVIVNYTLADTFMQGDTPAVGLTVYGKSVTGDSSVKYEVWDESAPDKKYTASGKAFSRVNIPLWQMNTTGRHALIIKASVAGGASDTVKHEYDVVTTNRTVNSTEFFDVKSGMKFTQEDSSSASGISRIVFADAGRGMYLSELIDMTYGSRMRLETAAAGSEAAALIEEYFPEYGEYLPETGCDIAKYQKSDGGFAILPYAASDVKTTAQLTPLFAENCLIDTNALEEYLETQAETCSGAEKAQALYGLAVLGYDVADQLDGACSVDASAEENIYIALAYTLLGNTDKASDIYDDILAPLTENTDPYCRLKVSGSVDDITEMTAACMYLAAMLGKPEAEGMYNYCVRNDSSEVITDIYKILYIKAHISDAAAEKAAVTYSLNGETATKDLENGSAVVSVPSSQLDNLSITSVSGDVCAVLISRSEAQDVQQANDYVTVKRRYYVKGTSDAATAFKQGDIVKVNVWVEYKADALKGAYTVTDYLPAGLAYVDNSAMTGGVEYDEDAMWWCENDGNSVIFNDWCAEPGKGRLYTYYARVVSPGTFTAEGAVVQSGESAAAVYAGSADTVVIK